MAKIIRSKQVAKRVGQTLDELTKQLEAGNYDVAQLLRDDILDQVFDTPSPASTKLSRLLDEMRDIYKSGGTNVEKALSFLRDPKEFISKARETKTTPTPVKGKVKSKSAEVLLKAGKESATVAQPKAAGGLEPPPIASDAARHYAALQGINAYLPYLPESQQKDILRVIKDRSMGIDEYLEKYGKSGPVSLHVKNAADTAGAVNTALATMKEKGRGRRTYDIHRLLEQAGARNTAYLYRLEDINRELSLIRDRLRSGNLSPDDAEKATKLYGQLRGEATRLNTNLKRTVTAGKLPQDMAERFQRASESAVVHPKVADIRKSILSQTKKATTAKSKEAPQAKAEPSTESKQQAIVENRTNAPTQQIITSESQAKPATKEGKQSSAKTSQQKAPAVKPTATKRPSRRLSTKTPFGRSQLLTIQNASKNAVQQQIASAGMYPQGAVGSIIATPPQAGMATPTAAQPVLTIHPVAGLNVAAPPPLSPQQPQLQAGGVRPMVTFPRVRKPPTLKLKPKTGAKPTAAQAAAASAGKKPASVGKLQAGTTLAKTGQSAMTAARQAASKAAAGGAAGSLLGNLLKKGGGALKKNKKAAIIAALIGAGILASQLLGQREEEQPEQLPPPTPLPPRAYNQNEAARQLMLAAYRQRLQEDSARRLASLGQTARMTPPMQPGTRALLQYVGALPNGE